MRWVPDHTGRFRWRPYYSREELDARCEARVERFLREHRGMVAYPISTDELMVLIEQEADDLDVCADLSDLGDEDREVEGVTTFVVGRRPRVQIAYTLLEDDWREPRLRTTLAHEFGHVLLHNFVRRETGVEQLKLFGDPPGAPFPVQQCTAASMARARRVDWMEWQAGYACGALLMPRTALGTAVRTSLGADRGAVYTHDPDARRVSRSIQRQFRVSEAAARVRLLQLGYLTDAPPPPSLFAVR